MPLNFLEQRLSDLFVELNIHFIGFYWQESAPPLPTLIDRHFQNIHFASRYNQTPAFDNFRAIMLEHLVSRDGMELEDLEWDKIKITYNKLLKTTKYLRQIKILN